MKVKGKKTEKAGKETGRGVPPFWHTAMNMSYTIVIGTVHYVTTLGTRDCKCHKFLAAPILTVYRCG